MLVLKDEFSVINDHRLASFIVDSHINSHPSELQAAQQNRMMEIEVETNRVSSIDQKLFKKYIIYAKTHFGHPQMTEKCS